MLIETKDRWEFFNEIAPLFFNALKALEEMESAGSGWFIKDGVKYKFVANPFGYYKLTTV